MKRFVLLIFIALLLSSCQKTQTQTQSESIPIMGYDKVTWGTSIQDVRRAYGISDTVATYPFPGYPDMVGLAQEEISDSIETRYFIFIGNKLCEVNVVYRRSTITEQELLTALKVKYGESTGYEEEDWGNLSIKNTIFGRYSPELIVYLSRRSDLRTDEEWFMVDYIVQKFIDEYEASKVEL